MQNWDSRSYDKNHSFVAEYGNDVLGLLQAQPGERILDLGCGTGTLTNKIAQSGIQVIGIDSSVDMVKEAQAKFPAIEFMCADGHNFNLGYSKFDAVFSNAALHWMMEPQKVITSVYHTLKPGGRFVFEMGGKGNIHNLLSKIDTAARKFKILETQILNFYPSLAEYAGLLAAGGFEITYAQLFQRPTILEGGDGLRNWVKMFRNSLIAQINPNDMERFFIAVEDLARPQLFKDGNWVADYVRLRMVAYKL